MNLRVGAGDQIPDLEDLVVDREPIALLDRVVRGAPLRTRRTRLRIVRVHRRSRRGRKWMRRVRVRRAHYDARRARHVRRVRGRLHLAESDADTKRIRVSVQGSSRDGGRSRWRRRLEWWRRKMGRWRRLRDAQRTHRGVRGVLYGWLHRLNLYRNTHDAGRGNDMQQLRLRNDLVWGWEGHSSGGICDLTRS